MSIALWLNEEEEREGEGVRENQDGIELELGVKLCPAVLLVRGIESKGGEIKYFMDIRRGGIALFNWGGFPFRLSCSSSRRFFPGHRAHL